MADFDLQIHLPLPDIKDDNVCQHSFKTHRFDEKRLRPPKLKHRCHHDANLNRSTSSGASATANVISFRGGDSNISDSDAQPLSAAYDCSLNESYFEQCFTCLAKIGEGSFGEVFKVRSKEDGMLYAVKMSKELFRGEHYRQERLEEVKRYEQFSGHSNCLRFHRAWEQDDRLFMQMELCRENLETYLLRCRQIPEEKVWTIMLDLLMAVKSLHDRNLIHLDIKLDNVLMTDDNTCKLADFGLVIDVDKANLDEALEGDSRYIAPEIMQGNFSKAADVFSLGIAMLELSCCLDLPPNGPLWQQLRRGLLPDEFVKTISGELLAVVRHMMAPDPQKRPTVDQLLAHNRFASMLRERKRWQLALSIKHTIYQSHRAALSRVRNWRTLVLSLLQFLMRTINVRGFLTDRMLTSSVNSSSQLLARSIVRTHIISSTPTTADRQRCKADANNLTNDIDVDSSNIGFSPQGTPTNLGRHIQFVNSTPLNHKSKSSLDTSVPFAMIDANDLSPLLNDKEFNSFETSDTESSSFDPSNCKSKLRSLKRKQREPPSSRGKRLFEEIQQK